MVICSRSNTCNGDSNEFWSTRIYQ